MNGLRFDHCEQTRAHMAPQRRGGLFLFYKLVVQALLARYVLYTRLARGLWRGSPVFECNGSC